MAQLNTSITLHNVANIEAAFYDRGDNCWLDLVLKTKTGADQEITIFVDADGTSRRLLKHIAESISEFAATVPF